MDVYERFGPFGTFNNEFAGQFDVSQEAPRRTGGTPAPTDAGATPRGTGTAVPGFRALTGLSALGGCAWRLHHRREDAGTEDDERT